MQSSLKECDNELAPQLNTADSVENNEDTSGQMDIPTQLESDSSLSVSSSQKKAKEGQDYSEVSPNKRYIRFNERYSNTANIKASYRGFDTKNGIEVVWQKIYLSALGEAEQEPIMRSLIYLKDIQQKHIVEYLSIWMTEEPRTVNLITTYLDPLEKFVAKVKTLRWRIIKKWCKQLLTGLQYLHSSSPVIVHRNLNLGNIFMNSGLGEIYLGGMWLSAVLAEGSEADNMSELISTYCYQGRQPGSPAYKAPEVLANQPLTTKVDIYSFGMCLLVLLTREDPYVEVYGAYSLDDHEQTDSDTTPKDTLATDGTTEETIMTARENGYAAIASLITKGVLPEAIERVSQCHPEAGAFLRSCLSLNPRDRKSAEELLNDDFLQQAAGEGVDDSVVIQPARGNGKRRGSSDGGMEDLDTEEEGEGSPVVTETVPVPVSAPKRGIVIVDEQLPEHNTAHHESTPVEDDPSSLTTDSAPSLNRSSSSPQADSQAGMNTSQLQEQVIVDPLVTSPDPSSTSKQDTTTEIPIVISEVSVSTNNVHGDSGITLHETDHHNVTDGVEIDSALGQTSTEHVVTGGPDSTEQVVHNAPSSSVSTATSTSPTTQTEAVTNFSADETTTTTSISISTSTVPLVSEPVPATITVSSSEESFQVESSLVKELAKLGTSDDVNEDRGIHDGRRSKNDPEKENTKQQVEIKVNTQQGQQADRAQKPTKLNQLKHGDSLSEPRPSSVVIQLQIEGRFTRDGINKEVEFSFEEGSDHVEIIAAEMKDELHLNLSVEHLVHLIQDRMSLNKVQLANSSVALPTKKEDMDTEHKKSASINNNGLVSSPPSRVASPGQAINDTSDIHQDVDTDTDREPKTTPNDETPVVVCTSEQEQHVPPSKSHSTILEHSEEQLTVRSVPDSVGVDDPLRESLHPSPDVSSTIVDVTKQKASKSISPNSLVKSASTHQQDGTSDVVALSSDHIEENLLDTVTTDGVNPPVSSKVSGQDGLEVTSSVSSPLSQQQESSSKGREEVSSSSSQSSPPSPTDSTNISSSSTSRTSDSTTLSPSVSTTDNSQIPTQGSPPSTPSTDSTTPSKSDASSSTQVSPSADTHTSANTSLGAFAGTKLTCSVSNSSSAEYHVVPLPDEDASATEVADYHAYLKEMEAIEKESQPARRVFEKRIQKHKIIQETCDEDLLQMVNK